MEIKSWDEIEKAKDAALGVLLHNAKGPFHGLPRTAGWGYPEPYTRDLMISILGVAVAGNQKLTAAMEKTLVTLSKNQSERGHIPSFIHDGGNRGASDTTPLFLLAVGIFRKFTGKPDFLEEAVQKALTWMEYQSPSDDYLVGQLPTSDWRDEQWVLGFGLFVNTLTYSYLRMLGYDERAKKLRGAMRHFTITGGSNDTHLQEGMVVKKKPYYALWSYKIYSSERFDLLGNGLAILSGLAPTDRAENMIEWIEKQCEKMMQSGDLAIPIAPNLFPFILPGDEDWLPRYEKFNNPGDYHNGGIWPFISGFQIAALTAAGKHKLARQKLDVLTSLIKIPYNKDLDYGFNEWYKAQNGLPMGQDWQTWSASMYLYAATCVQEKKAPFFNFEPL